MIFNLFKRDPNAPIVDRLYEAVAAASRNPVFYRNLGVPDTVEGRFDMVVIHGFLVLRQLNRMPKPADELAQDLVDTIFRHFDSALRELGVGDISVPKRMKTIASAFYGRSKAYEDSLSDAQALSAALELNLFNRTVLVPHAPGVIAAYIQASAKSLSETTFEDFVAAKLPFGSPVPEQRS